MERLEIFNQYRSLLFAIAYRMLGSTTDAKDMVQEAWIRWQSTKAIAQSPKAFLSSLITRLCIDQLRSARVQREKYVGIWLPEPLITKATNQSEDNIELAESLSFAFLTLLECLSPTERAIFLLREVFDYDYSEIARIVDKRIPNCRQIVRRARQPLVLRRPSVSPSLKQKEKVTVQGGGQAARGIDSGIDSVEALSWGSREGEALPLLEARIASVMNSKTCRF